MIPWQQRFACCRGRRQTAPASLPSTSILVQAWLHAAGIPTAVHSRCRSTQQLIPWPEAEMNIQSLKDTIRRELPDIMRTDPDFRGYILELTRQEYAGRAATEDRFYELLAELRREREEGVRKWDEEREEQNRKWEEQNRKWDEQNRKWDEQQAEQREEFKRIHEEIMAQAQRHDRSIGALGSRWGLQSEKAFRDALAGILEKNFGVQVLNVNEYDDQGTVFGRPDQIELDVIIQNGLLLICELKSSIDKAGMYIFERKARFYEQRHQRTANRLIVISPMIDARARQVAERLGIETYGDSLEVQAL